MYYAKGIERILEINKQLPSDRKIRVISISAGWEPSQDGYQVITDAVNKAKAAGIFIICSSTEDIYGLKFHGLGRPTMNDPDNFNSYEPGSWWAKTFYSGEKTNDRLLVPMDSRATAGPSGVADYAFYKQGGWSWSIPYIAGVYALAVQVDPEITPEKFWDVAMKTGKNNSIETRRKGN